MSLKRKKRGRFEETSEEDLAELLKPQVPKNTETSTRWAMKNFRDWYEDYNARNPSKCCPEEVVLSSCSPELLNKWLCVFVSETRNQNGEKYPPRTLYSLLTGILRYMRIENSNYPNFLEKNSPVFSGFAKTLDNIFKDLRKSGVGSESQHTEVISRKDEDTLWSSGVLNVETGQGLLRAVFYYNGKCFCLRGGQEHRELRLSQLKRSTNPVKYTYSENASKNRKGGVAQMRVEHKTVVSIADPEAGSRCHVYLLDKYMEKLPLQAIEKDIFYCRPLPTTPTDPTKPWFTAVPIGRNYLTKMVSNMFAEAGLEGNKTNHSLRVTGASALFDAGVPERIIQARTGHRSLDALRVYERVTDAQSNQVSKILSGNKTVFSDKTDTADLAPSEKKSQLCLDSKPIPQPHSVPGNGSSNPNAQYNNCTITMYNSPMMPMPSLQSPYPQSMMSTTSPSFQPPMLPASYPYNYPIPPPIYYADHQNISISSTSAELPITEPTNHYE